MDELERLAEQTDKAGRNSLRLCIRFVLLFPCCAWFSPDDGKLSVRGDTKENTTRMGERTGQ